jgi:hypothetical protein
MAKAEATVIEFDTDAIRARELEVAQETDEQIIERLRDRFNILTEVTRAVKRGTMRAVIVSGPPGVGKSYGVEDVLSKEDLFNTLRQRQPKYEIVKGAMSALGLYAKLHQFKDRGNVVVFDDCDSIFFDDLSLNILKAALDSSKRRWISWNTDSRLLRTEGIPGRFEFAAGVIFITNIRFENVRSKKLRDHLAALESRCHYIDLDMDTTRERLLRIRQIVNDGMLQEFEFEEAQKAELLTYIESNVADLRELSLRMVLKLAELRQNFPDTWQRMAQESCMRRRRSKQ